MCNLARGENELESTKFCQALSNLLGKPPETITVDFNPAWDLAIKKVFPESIIIRDGFHTVQLINRAILKELSWISNKIFTSAIKEVKKLYQLVKEDKFKGKSSIFQPINEAVAEFKSLYFLLVDLSKINDLSTFYQRFGEVIIELRNKNTNSSIKLCKELINRLPQNGLTEKNLKYYRIQVKSAFSCINREFRRNLEQKRKEFNKIKYLLLKRPEKFSDFEQTSLDEFLINYPNFKKYRELSLRISNIYHTTPQMLNKSIILDIKLWENAHPELKAAVKTVKKNVDEILNFIKLPSKQKIKNYYQMVRVTPEYSMRKIKDLNRSKFGFRNINMSCLFIQNKLNCPVIIS